MYNKIFLREVSEIGKAEESSLVSSLDMATQKTYRVSWRVIPDCLRRCADVVYIPGVSAFASRAYLEAKAEEGGELQLKDLINDPKEKISGVSPASICRF